MKESITTFLQCPICKAAGRISTDGRSFLCNGARTHCFDFSKSGYLNLAGPHGGAGDLKAAVRARTLFLEAGYYEPLSDAINQILCDVGAKSVLDAGCGEGYYSNRMAQGRAVLGVDLSTVGIDHAAKVAKRMDADAGYAVASLFELPVRSEAFDAVTNLFAPCAEAEFMRVLGSGGHIIVVAAGERHLLGLKHALYENPYENRGRADLPKDLPLLEKKQLRYEITVEGNEAIGALFSMTPYYWRTSEEDRAKLDTLDTLTTEVDFDIFVYRKGTV